MKGFLAAFGVFLAVFENAFGFACYECDTDSHGDVCAYHSKLSKQQTEFISHCQGTCKIAMYEVSGEIKVHMRSCDNEHHQGGCTGWEKVGNGSIITCHCRRDFCNVDWQMIHESKMQRLNIIQLKMAALMENAAAPTAWSMGGLLILICFLQWLHCSYFKFF